MDTQRASQSLSEEEWGQYGNKTTKSEGPNSTMTTEKKKQNPTVLELVKFHLNYRGNKHL